MANIHLVTGYAGMEHVTSADQGAFNASIFGNGQFVLNRGNKFSASVITNNLIRVLDGDILMQGRHIRLNEGTYVDLTIESGTGGYLRNDLIVVRYTKNGTTGIEECNLVVIKGENAVDNPVDPAYTSGDIIAGNAILNDMPLYRVPLNGINVGELVPLFTAKETYLADEKQDKTNKLATESEVADGDYIPFYDTSASANKKVLWSRVKTILGAVFAPLTHDHAISDVTNLQGTLNGKAASTHNHTAEEVTSGTLSADRLPIVPVEKGGTGATTALGALTALGCIKYHTGSYTGTGTHGSANRNSITFPFVPKLVIITADGKRKVGTYDATIMWLNGGVQTWTTPTYETQLPNFSLSGTTLSWYAVNDNESSAIAAQNNKSGQVYNYIAFG